MSSSSSSGFIPTDLIISRGNNCQLANISKLRKYRPQLSFFTREEEEYFSMNYKLFQESLHDQRRKRITSTELDYWPENDMRFLAKDIQRIPSCIRKFNFKFQIYWDFDFNKSRLSTDSQYTVRSDNEENSEEDSDLVIQSPFQMKHQRSMRKIFKQAKRVNNLSLTFIKIDSSQYRAFQFLPLMNLLEYCHIKIKVRAPTDIVELRDLFKKAKQRNYWPRMKSMVIYLRHSYNKENCTSKFVNFCQNLQEICETTQDLLPWFRIKLKVKYMWRLDESALFYLKEVLQKAPNRFVKLSLITNQTRDLEPLFKAVGELNNLHGFSLRYNKLFDINSQKALEELTKSLKKIESLKSLKINQKDLLNKEQDDNFLFAKERILQNIKDLSQISSFCLKGQVSLVDKTLWDVFSSSISNLSKLQALTIDLQIVKQEEFYPDSNGFIDFFAGLMNLYNLRIFSFDFSYDYFCESHPEFQKINGSQTLKTLCKSLQSLKELEDLHLGLPWISSQDSDVEELTKIIPVFQKLKRFFFRFFGRKTFDPLQNRTFLKFAKVICCLTAIESLKVIFRLEEISNLTYEAAMLLLKKLGKGTHWNLELKSKQIDQEISKRLKIMLANSIYISHNSD